MNAAEVLEAVRLGWLTRRQAEIAIDFLEVQLVDADPLRFAAPAPYVYVPPTPHPVTRWVSTFYGWALVAGEWRYCIGGPR